MASVSYRDAGLDLDLYEQTLAGLPPLLRRTHTPRVLDGFGGFASLFSLDYNTRLFARNYRHPVLVSCTDGVGSKLKVASLAGKHDTVGIDLVAMSVNDCLCTGGEPLVFLDYLAMPKDDPALTRDLVKGISDGCIEADCALVGGETAILPDFYQPGDYDMAGFCVGVVERDHIINGKAIQVGDVVLGLASTRPALQRLQPGAQDRLRRRRAEGRRTSCRNWAARSARNCWSRRAFTSGRSRTSSSTTRSSGAWSAAWPTSPAAAWWTTCRASCRRAGGRFIEARLAGAAGLRLAATARRRAASRRWTASSTAASAS